MGDWVIRAMKSPNLPSLQCPTRHAKEKNVIDFRRSNFTWKSHPWLQDAYYRYPGGFVGAPGEVYQVRFNLEGACTIQDDRSGQTTELFVSAPCRFEYTIATRNLFQVPSAEFRFAFSRALRLQIQDLGRGEKAQVDEIDLTR